MIIIMLRTNYLIIRYVSYVLVAISESSTDSSMDYVITFTHIQKQNKVDLKK